MLNVRISARRLYMADGYRAVNVKRPLGMTLFFVAALAALLFIPLLVMLSVRTDVEVAEWWTRNIQAGWEVFAGTLTGWLPFSVLELFIVIGIGLGVYLFVRLVINLCRARFLAIFTGALWLLLGAVYILDMYIMSMGFGYYRAEMPFPRAGEDYDAEKITQVIEYFIEDYNTLAEELDRDENGCVKCPYSFDELDRRVRREYARLTDGYFASYTPKAKPVVNSWFLSSMLITGVTFLPFGEATVNVAAPPTSTTVTLAHELAHTKGVQREGDANLLARYVLLASDDGYLRYCGYYASFNNLLEALVLADKVDDYHKYAAMVSPLVRKERRYAYDYWAKQPDIIGKIAEFFNNLYLQSNGVPNGTDSYNDANQGDVVIPVDPDTGKPQVDPETGEEVRIITFSRMQTVFFALYESRTGGNDSL